MAVFHRNLIKVSCRDLERIALRTRYLSGIVRLARDAVLRTGLFSVAACAAYFGIILRIFESGFCGFRKRFLRVLGV